jgi:trigger factor
MKVEVEEISPVKKALRIHVPPDIVANEFQAAFSDLKKRVKVPGFRPGKVPLSLIEKRYGHEVEEDVLRKLIPSYYQKAVEETGIKPVEFPAIDRIEIKRDEPLSFTATVEVRPPIALRDYAGIPIVRRNVAVTEEGIDRALAALREEHGELVSCAGEHAVVEGDYAIIDFEGKIDGKPIELKKGGPGVDRGRIADYLVQVGSKSLLPGFEESLIGRKKGEGYAANLSIPSDHPDETIRGKEALFSIQVKEIKRKTLPDLDDEFAKDLGMESLTKLRERVSSDLLKHLQTEAARAEKNELIGKLVEMHSFESPSSLVQRELESIVKSFKQSNPGADPSSVRGEFETMAKDRVKATLILSAIAEAERIEVTEREVEEEIARISERLRLGVNETKRFILGQEKTLDGIRARLKEEKTIEGILSKADIKTDQNP